MAMASRKTGFDKFFDKQMRKPSLARGYKKARAEIDAVDQLVRALDAARIKTGMSKAELARVISAKPEIIRRLFTSKANPTLETVTKIAEALGYRLELVKGRKGPAHRAAA
jgi:ribosome-binding protein aMBF1 (putative translation factor)